jgi:excisionase family DNA binding protein
MSKARPPAEPGMRLHSVPVVADRLESSVATVRRAIWLGQLPVYRIGRAVRISEDDLQAYLARRRKTSR